MTPQEAKKCITDVHELGMDCNLMSKEEFEFHETLIAALEKQIPMEHHHTKINEIHDEARTSICPSCLGCIITRKDEYPNFCTWCGQKIDWSETNDKH